MKKRLIAVLIGAALAAAARADTPLTIGAFAPGPGGPCYDDTLLVQNPPQAAGNFTLPGVSGTGTVNSVVHYVINNATSHSYIRYDYSVDMSGMPSATNHCVRLLIHFGTPHLCSWDVIESSTGAGVLLASATKAPYGDITFTFGSGCLSPSQTSIDFGMLSDAQPKTNSVTIIDDYTDLASGLSHEARINVTAVVPDVPPDWVLAPGPIPYPIYQGILFTNLATNAIPIYTNGPYDFTFQLFDAASNGLPVGPIVTQTVQVARGGLFNVPLLFDPVSIDWGDRWLDIGVRPSGANVNFSPIGRQAITPTPQAFYAYSAGTVSDISPDQAVTGLNGITGNLTIAAGQGIQIFADGSTKTITISQSGQLSDRNAKTDFSAVRPEEILAKLAALPISSWRYTNETAGVRHVGPMAQDFKAAFDFGTSDKTIGTIDESGVALVAIQGLNQKIDELKGELTRRDAENAALQQRLDKLEQLLNDKERAAPEKRER